jgi:hypothetical protein
MYKLQVVSSKPQLTLTIFYNLKVLLINNFKYFDI